MKLQKIKLHDISGAELNEREMCRILGGVTCQCGCHYTTSGGSSTEDNNSANDAGGLTSDPTDTPTPDPTHPLCIVEPNPHDTLCWQQAETCVIQTMC